MTLVLWRAAASAWALLIWTMSSSPFRSSESRSWLAALLESWFGFALAPETAASINHSIRKSMHVAEYAVFTVLLYFALQARLTWVAGVAVGFAILDEIHQAFVPGRGASAMDVLIDSLGVVLAMQLLQRFYPQQPGNQSDIV